MNILFVALEFPPLGGIPIRRPMGFARYLPEFGIEPIVVTSDESSLRRMFHTPIDKSGLDEIRPGLRIERIPCPPRSSYRDQSRLARFFRSFFSISGDPHGQTWRPHLERHLHALVKAHAPEAIYVCLPPFSMAPLWCELNKVLRLPLILDFRDAWSQLCVGPYWSRLHYQAARRLERHCLTKAHRVICSSDQILEDFLATHPGLQRQKFVTILNGIDRDIDAWPVVASGRAPHELFIIGYVGSFYYIPAARDGVFSPWWKKRPHHYFQFVPRKEDWLYRSPYFFFRATAALLQGKPELRTRLKIRFAGAKPAWIDDQVKEFGLHDVVEFLGALSHDKALQFQAECDALLVTSSKVIGGRDYSIAGKTFEYFQMQKPILAFVAEGAQKDILVRSGLAVICDPDDVSDSVVKMADLVEGRSRLVPNQDFLRGLHRRELTRKLAEVILEARRESPGQGRADEFLRGDSAPVSSTRTCGQVE